MLYFIINIIFLQTLSNESGCRCIFTYFFYVAYYLNKKHSIYRKDCIYILATKEILAIENYIHVYNYRVIKYMENDKKKIPR